MQNPSEQLRATEFARLMHDYQDMVYSTAARLLGNDVQAEDVAQEVFLRAYQHLDRLLIGDTRGGWLKTVATNLSLNHLSRYRRRWRLFSEAEGEDGAPPDIEVPDTLLDGLADEQRHACVERALQRLPQHQRVPLVLFHFEELSYQEIAQRLHISLSKVKTDILRARSALARLLAASELAAPGGTVDP